MTQLELFDNKENNQEAKSLENAFDWALEFPLLCDENGDWQGFDVVLGNPPYIPLKKIPELKEIQNEFETYTANGDIYTLFIERGLQILQPEGRLGFITSNKWLRAAYGESLREFLLKNTTIEKIIDFDGLKVFDEATVDTSIIQLLKHKNGKQPVDAVRFDKTFDLEKDSISEYFEEHKIQLSDLNKGIWNLTSRKENSIKQKVEKLGLPLKDWDLQIYRGILTGCNEAFIINDSIKNKLIRVDARNAEIIKPILRGRDIRKYCYSFKNVWLINTSNGYVDKILNEETDIFKNKDNTFTYKNHIEEYYNVFRVEHARGQQFRINRIIAEIDYPSVYQHLKKYENELVVRDDKGNHWSNLRNCAFENAILRDKIIYSEIVQSPQFYYDNEEYYPEATCFFMVGESLKYLTAMLNSKLLSWAFKNFYAGGGLGATGFRYKKAFLEKLPIIKISENEQDLFVKLVDEIQFLKKHNSEFDTTNLEYQIDKLVYELYELTPEEIAMIEK